MKTEPLISVIIPVFNGSEYIIKCLTAVYGSDYKYFEVIVIDDGSTDQTLELAGQYPCSLIKLERNVGAAAARNKGVESGRGELLFFLDVDIIIEKDTLSQIVKSFDARSEISALFCSYQKNTIPANFFSRYKNYVHHFTHQISRENAITFCAGFGAIKKEVFINIGGFDPEYRNLEDIELGYRLHRSGYRIYLNKDIRVTHCKYYSFIGLIKSDVLHRAIPWTQIMLDKKMFQSDLNTKYNNILSVLTSYLIFFILPIIFIEPKSLYFFLILLIVLVMLNLQFINFVRKEAGFIFTIKTVLMSWLTYLYSGFGLLVGIKLYLIKKWRRK